MEQNLKFKAGEVVVLTSGQYSDYGLTGFVVAIADFDMSDEAILYALDSRSKYDDYGFDKFDYDEFVAWLIKKELVIPVKYREIHLGSYDDFSNDFKIPPRMD